MSGAPGTMGYVIDGVEGKELTLQRGVRYTFQMQDVDITYPFIIAKMTLTGRTEAFYNGVEGNFVSGNGALYFTPDSTAPGVLWYASSSHHYPNMGWKINITGTASAPSDAPDASAGTRLSQAWPNPAQGRTTLQLDVDRAQQVRVTLHDAAGNLAGVIHDGVVAGSLPLSFDTAALPAGLYNCVAVVGGRVISRKVIVGF